MKGLRPLLLLRQPAPFVRGRNLALGLLTLFVFQSQHTPRRHRRKRPLRLLLLVHLLDDDTGSVEDVLLDLLLAFLSRFNIL